MHRVDRSCRYWHPEYCMGWLMGLGFTTLSTVHAQESCWN